MAEGDDFWIEQYFLDVAAEPEVPAKPPLAEQPTGDFEAPEGDPTRTRLARQRSRHEIWGRHDKWANIKKAQRMWAARVKLPED